MARRIDQLAEDPRGPHTKPLMNLPGRRAARVGGYRIVFTIDDRAEVVQIIADSSWHLPCGCSANQTDLWWAEHKMKDLVLCPRSVHDGIPRWVGRRGGLMIRLIIQTIRRDPSRSDQTDEAPT